MVNAQKKLLDHLGISQLFAVVGGSMGGMQVLQWTINYPDMIRNAIMIAENLIKNKGFQDLIIFINGDSISIIVKAKELKEEQIAQIQNIISRELKGEIENIHISNKE